MLPPNVHSLHTTSATSHPRRGETDDAARLARVDAAADSQAQQRWADSMTPLEREEYEDGIARRRAERGVL